MGSFDTFKHQLKAAMWKNDAEAFFLTWVIEVTVQHGGSGCNSFP